MPSGDGLKEIAHRRQITLPDLIRSIDAQRQHANLSRLFVLEFYRSQIPDPPDGEGV